MLEKFLAWFGLALVEELEAQFEVHAHLKAALSAAWGEIDELRARLSTVEADLDTEVTYSADGCASALDDITAQVPVVLARHA